jgi:protein required for attachment to host cells
LREIKAWPRLLCQSADKHLVEVSMRSEEILYLLVNDNEARLVRAAGSVDALHELGHVSRKSFGDAHRHPGSSPGTDHDDRARHAFMKHVAEFAHQAWVRDGKPRVVLAAAAKVRGELRKALPKDFAEAVVSEQHKDLAGLALHDLPSHFKHIGVV